MGTKVNTNISIDPDLKKAGQELFSDLGLDLSTAVSIFIRQALRVQGLPFSVLRENSPVSNSIASVQIPAARQLGLGKGKFNSPADFDIDNEEIAKLFLDGTL